MADAAGSPNLIPAVLALAGALLAPVAGTIASLFSRSELQRKRQEAEYGMVRLELLERAITVGKALSEISKKPVDLSVAETEYLKIVSSFAEPPPPSAEQPLPLAQYSPPARIFMVPWPQSTAGWIASAAFYIFLTLFLLLIALVAILSTSEVFDFNFRVVVTEIPGLLLIAFLARYWAIRSAKAAIRRARAKFDREVATLAKLAAQTAQL